jgi:hypothetical protein
VKRRKIIFLTVAILIVIAIIVLSFSVFQRALAPAAPTPKATWIGEAQICRLPDSSSSTWSGI